MKAFSIETRLYFISAIAALALATIASLTWFRAQYVYQIQEDVNHIVEIEILLLRLDKINGNIVTGHDRDYLVPFEKTYAELMELTEHFVEEADIVGVDKTFLDDIVGDFILYRSLFLTIADNLQEIGYDNNEGHWKGMRDALRAAEVTLMDITDIDVRNQVHQRLLVAQHSEKSLMLQHQDAYMDEFGASYALLLSDAQALIADEAVKEAFIAAISAYRHHFTQLSSIAMEVGLTPNNGLRAEFDTIAHDAHEDVAEIRALVTATASQREKQIDTIIILVSALFAVAILLLIHMLGRSVIIPIKRMIEVMGSLVKGEYEIKIPARDRRDEIGEMAAALEVFRQTAIEHDTAKKALQEANDQLEERVAKRTQSLTESESALFNMIHESPIAIGLTDENGTPVFWNDSFLKFGWRKDTPGASNDFQLMFAKPDLRREFFERLKRGEAVRHQEVEIITASEEPAWVEMSIQSLIFEGQKSFLTWVHDITERKMKEEVQAEARRSAEEANKAKSDFLATMSHEIRTPLNGIMTMAEMLETTSLTSEQQGMAVIVRDSSATLVGIINDVLDFSKIESGNLALDLINMSLVQVVENVADLLGAQAAEKGIRLMSHTDPRAHDFFVGDPMRLRQVLTNLVGNAVKFTEKGEVIIEASTENAFPDRATAVFRVIDTGIGIPKETQEKLFQPFVQADTSTARQFGGTGLGLSISKALVEAMGGEIGVESTPGEGTTFWVKVPLEVKKEQRTSRKDQLSGKQALIVSDSRNFAGAIKDYLRFAGARVEIVSDHDRALKEARAAHADGYAYDMMLIDGSLSDNGVEALIEEAHADPAMVATQVIFMGYRSRIMVDRPRYLDHVFTQLPMPMRRSQLWEVAAAAVGLESLDGRLLNNNRESDSGPRQFAPPDSKTAREAGAMILVAEDNPVNQQVISILLNRLGYAADIVDDGVMALDALRNNEYGLLLTDCHMPNMDGYDLARAIRADEAAEGKRRIPIIALTADALIGVDEKCRESGMDVSLKKPISRDELDQEILKALPAAGALRRHVGEGVKKAAESSAPVFPKPSSGASYGKAADVDTDTDAEEGKLAFDVSYLDEVTGGDPDMTEVLIGSYIDTTPPLIDDLVAAMAAGDVTATRETAHAIKGASNMAGALRLGFICEKIQEAMKKEKFDSVLAYKDNLHQEFDAFLAAWKAHSSG